MNPCRPATLFVAALSLSVAGSIPVRGADEASWQALADAAVEAEAAGRLEEAERMLLGARREAERVTFGVGSGSYRFELKGK